MQDLASKGIDHADSMVTDSPNDGMIAPTPGNQLVEEHTLVNKMNLLAIRHQPAVFVGHLARVGNHTIITLRLKIVVKEDEFTIGGDFFPVEDSDAGSLRSAPLPIAIDQCM